MADYALPKGVTRIPVALCQLIEMHATLNANSAFDLDFFMTGMVDAKITALSEDEFRAITRVLRLDEAKFRQALVTNGINHPPALPRSR